MSKPEFTPGPWGCWASDLRGGRYWTVDRPGAEDPIDIHEADNGEADARLIAAAPDMYEALLAAKVVIEMMERPEGMGGRVNAALDKRLAQIDAAIAKAEGRAA